MAWSGVDRWRATAGLARDTVRQELVARQLLGHLPAPPARVLDVGCGQGIQLLRLAHLGFEVVGVDPSDDLLAEARAAFAEAGLPVDLRHGDLLGLVAAGDDGFDVVLCHGVVMYVPSLRDSVAVLARAVRPGGLISLLTRNRAGIAMRAGMSGDWAAAVAGFDAHRYDNRLGIAEVRADEPAEVADAFAAVDVDVVAWYGVRLFTDHWGDVPPPPDFDAVLAVEAEAGRRDPYRQVAALTHTIGLRAERRARR